MDDFECTHKTIKWCSHSNAVYKYREIKMYKRFDCLCGNNNMFSKFGNSNLARDRQNDILYTTIRLRIYEIQQIPGMFPNIHILV